MQAFDQYYGSNTLDASNLMMPLVFFMSPYDPMMSKTIDAILRPPHKGGLVSNSLVYRYNVNEVNDGLSGDEGTFNTCTFWLVEALTRSGMENSARLEQARLIFEQMLGYANHVGMYSEQIGLHGEALGNPPGIYPPGIDQFSLQPGQGPGLKHIPFTANQEKALLTLVRMYLLFISRRISSITKPLKIPAL